MYCVYIIYVCIIYIPNIVFIHSSILYLLNPEQLQIISQIILLYISDTPTLSSVLHLRYYAVG